MSIDNAEPHQSLDPRIGAWVYLLRGLLQRLESQHPGLVENMIEGTLYDRAAIDPAESPTAARGCEIADEALRTLRLMSAQLKLASATPSRIGEQP